jgi:hypothetical protein
MIIKYAMEDLEALNFNYVVQINNHEHHDCIFDCTNPGFWIEKRISFVVVNDVDTCFMHGFFYGRNEEMPKAELIIRLNKNEKRYYRVLNAKELAWFNNWLRNKP